MTAIAPPPLQAPPAPPPRSGRRRSRRVTPRMIVSILTIGTLLYLVLGPLIMLVVSSFENTKRGIVIRPPFPWTTANYKGVFGDSATYDVLGETLLFSAGALLLAFAVALTFSWLIERTDLPARNLFFVLVVAPSGIPALISAISWSLLLNPTNGFLNLVIRGAFGLGGNSGPINVYSLPWMIIVQGMALVPLTFLLITASLRGMNANLEDAARTSGASFGRILRTVSLPLLKPAIIGALVYEFVTVVEAVDIPLILGLPGHVTVLSTTIYNESHPAVGLPNYGASSSYGMFLLVLALAPLLFYNKVIGSSSSYATVTGKSFRPRLLKLGRWKPVAVLFCAGYIFVAFVLPLLMLIWASVQPYTATLSRDSLSRVTLEGYRATFSGSLFLGTVKHTLILGISAGLFAMVLSMLVSWIIVRSKSRFRWMADLLAFMPHAIPGVVIGLATLLVYLILPLPIYGTIWIIVIAMGTQYVSLGTRLTTGGIAQIQRGLEEAAEASGAKGWQVWQRVLFPLLRPVFLNGFLLVFLSSIQNLTLPLMLYSSGNVVLSTLIFTRFDTGDASGAAVLSVFMTVITVGAAVLLRGVTGKRGQD